MIRRTHGSGEQERLIKLGGKRNLSLEASGGDSGRDFERIHRSNLVGMGVIRCNFLMGK